MKLPGLGSKTTPRCYRLALALAGALLLAACGFSQETLQRGYVLPEGALEQVPVGATQEQVLIVLGTPSTVATVNGDAFFYISQKASRSVAFMPHEVVDQRVIAVYFDKERRVSRIANYGVIYSKAVDFYSLTTPTGSQTLSYLCNIFKNMGYYLSALAKTLTLRKGPAEMRALFNLYARLVSENSKQQERHDVRDLDHRVHSRSRSVLVGIADGITCDRSLVRIRAFAAVVPVLDVFLGVVPCATA